MDGNHWSMDRIGRCVCNSLLLQEKDLQKNKKKVSNGCASKIGSFKKESSQKKLRTLFPIS